MNFLLFILKKIYKLNIQKSNPIKQDASNNATKILIRLLRDHKFMKTKKIKCLVVNKIVQIRKFLVNHSYLLLFLIIFAFFGFIIGSFIFGNPNDDIPL